MATFEGALWSAVEDELAAAGFVPTEATLSGPPRGLVSRASLIGRVGASARDVVVVTAPAGYGKSTFLAELAAGDERPTAWITLTSGENDPAALLTYVAFALDEIEPVEAYAPLAHHVGARQTRKDLR